MADNHTQDLIQSVSNAETWRTLYPYTKMDLPVIEVKDMAKKYTDQIHDEVKNIVGEIFGGSMKKEAMKLRPRSWKEPHLLLYQRLENRPDYLGTEIHYDGCDITWSAMLCQDLMNTKVAELTFHVSVRLLSSGRVKSSYIQVNYITKDVRLPWVYEPFYSLSLMVWIQRLWMVLRQQMTLLNMRRMLSLCDLTQIELWNDVGWRSSA